MNPALLDPTGHRHALDAELRIYLEIAEREHLVSSMQELADIPAKPIIVCTRCRTRLEEILVGDIAHIREMREKVIMLLNQDESLTPSDILHIDDSIEELDMRQGFFEHERIAWQLAADEYEAGKQLILGENHDFADSNAFLRRYYKAIRTRRSHPLRPDPEFEIQP